MKKENYLRLNKIKPTWCVGCGNYVILSETNLALQELKLKKDNTVVVSGIGCGGRTAAYFDLDTVHGLHGRAIPLAEGIKTANKKLNVILISGDGDLAGIGTNHLIHTSRRNTNITTICSNNSVYAMTGGQLSPTTKKGLFTLTSPKGSDIEPINIQGLISSNKNFYYARTTVAHPNHLKECIKKAIKYKGFSFVDIITPCITNFGRRIGFKDTSAMLKSYKKYYKISKKNNGLKKNEIGIHYKK